MPKFDVYTIATASKLVGTYEASTKYEAIKKAHQDPNADFGFMLCHECGSEIEIDGGYEEQADEV